MTVGELKLALVGVDDSLPVYVHDENKVYPGSKEDSMHHTQNIGVYTNGPISNAHVAINVGWSFDW